MADSALRSRLIRLAHGAPELRQHLLPLLREAGVKEDLEALAKKRKPIFPGTWAKAPGRYGAETWTTTAPTGEALEVNVNWGTQYVNDAGGRIRNTSKTKWVGYAEFMVNGQRPSVPVITIKIVGEDKIQAELKAAEEKLKATMKSMFGFEPSIY